jgi:hypothetical protein
MATQVNRSLPRITRRLRLSHGRSLDRSSTIVRDSIAVVIVAATATVDSIAVADVIASVVVVADAALAVTEVDAAAAGVIAVSAAICLLRNTHRRAATTISRRIRTYRWATFPLCFRANRFLGSAIAATHRRPRRRRKLRTKVHTSRGTKRRTIRLT